MCGIWFSHDPVRTSFYFPVFLFRFSCEFKSKVPRERETRRLSTSWIILAVFLLSLFIKILLFGFFVWWGFVIFTTQVQPVAELVELSRRWAADGRQIRLNDVIAKGGTLRRTGSLRHRHTKVRNNNNTTTSNNFYPPLPSYGFFFFFFYGCCWGSLNYFAVCWELRAIIVKMGSLLKRFQFFFFFSFLFKVTEQTTFIPFRC